MQLYLIRHPRPRIAVGICYGQLDIDCDDPLPVAATLRPRLPAGTRIISSPLQRARKLAVALDPQASIDPRLSEINFGAWEGLSWNEIDRLALDAWAADVLGFRPPGGETVNELQQRAIDFASSLNAPHIALVTHAGILRALVGHWHKLPVAEWTQLNFAFGSLTTLEI
ncbi:MAG: alpha-ribazole phosphatase family protein [Betaproteobacteria bacterium]